MLKLKMNPEPTDQASSGKKNSLRAISRPCNICGERFRAATPQCCFCEECKLHSDLYRFHDWLPDQMDAA